MESLQLSVGGFCFDPTPITFPAIRVSSGFLRIVMEIESKWTRLDMCKAELNK